MEIVQQSRQDHASYESERKEEVCWNIKNRFGLPLTYLACVPTTKAVNRATAFLNNFDLKRLSGLRLVDIQGGNGALLAAVMMRNQDISGVLCDTGRLPEAIPLAIHFLRAGLQRLFWRCQK